LWSAKTIFPSEDNLLVDKREFYFLPLIKSFQFDFFGSDDVFILFEIKHELDLYYFMLEKIILRIFLLLIIQ